VATECSVKAYQALAATDKRLLFVGCNAFYLLHPTGCFTKIHLFLQSELPKEPESLIRRALLISPTHYLFFNKSRISVSKISSAVGAGGALVAASSFFLSELIPLITINIANAMMVKSITV